MTDDPRMCTTCGKMGGVCRWADDPIPCMRKQLERLRAFVDAVREAYSAELDYEALAQINAALLTLDAP